MSLFDIFKSKSKAEIEFEKIIKDLKTQLAITYETIENEEYTKRLNAAEHKQLFTNLIQILQSNKFIKNQIIVDGFFRLSKDTFSSLPRTIQILKNTDGSFSTIIEAKSKLAGGEKDPDKKKQPKGTFKKAKPAFVVPPTSDNPSNQLKIGDENYCYVSLTSNITNLLEEKKIKSIEDYKNSIRQEVALSNETSATVKLNYIFHENSETNTLKSTCYAKKGIPLSEYLLKLSLYKKLSEIHKKQIFFSLIQEIYTLHSNGIIHQDIKPDNIIVYYDIQNNSYFAKLTDLGCCSRIKKNLALATLGYESPEMVESNFINKYYHKNCENSSTIALFLASDERNKNYNTPCEKNDMWALGIIYLALIYNQNIFILSNNIKHEALGIKKVQEILATRDLWIQGLLNVNREQRMSSDEAYKMAYCLIPNNKSSKLMTFAYVHHEPKNFCDQVKEVVSKAYRFPFEMKYA